MTPIIASHLVQINSAFPIFLDGCLPVGERGNSVGFVVVLELMAGLAQVDWQSLANEAQVRALLEDFVSHYTLSGLNQLALAAWFERSPQGSEHKLLMLFTGPEMNNIEFDRQPLLWKAGVEGPPFIVIHWTSITFFSPLLRSNPNVVQQSFPGAEVIYFQRRWLTQEILDAFRIVTEPSHLIKVWCVYHDQYGTGQTVQALLASRAGRRQEVGIVTTWESPDFESRKAIFHVEVGQQWRPANPEGIMQSSGFYSDWLRGRRCYLLAEGGALYYIEKFEVIYAPDYERLVIERRPDDRYLEVYLRTVHPPDQPAA